MLLISAILISIPLQTLSAQGYLDMNTFKAEHVVTHGNGPTGDVTIYFSVPNWFGKSCGYCPIHFRVKPQKGLVFKSDGILRISMAASDRVSESGPRVVVEIPIEQGATEAHAEVLANLLDSQFINLFVTLDGRRLNGQRLYFWSNRGQNQSLRDLIVISPSTSANDRKRQAALEEMKKTGKWFSQSEFVANAGSVSSYADAAHMPSNWLYLSGLDQVSISLDELALLAPEALEALNHFVMAGGVIDISNVDSIRSAQQYFPIDPSTRSDESTKPRVRSNTSKNTLAVQPSDFASDFDVLESTVWDRFYESQVRASFQTNAVYPANVGTISVLIGSNAMDVAETIAKHGLDVGRAWLDYQLSGIETTATRFYDYRMKTPVRTDNQESLTQPLFFPHGFGMIRIDPRYHRDASSLIVEKSVSMLHPNRVERFRSGIGDDFWTWLIPSVGRTPAIPFLVFVVLFVGIVVPGLMIWCNRHKRRVWLVVAMPVMAVFFTCLLFTYGLFKDGLGAVSRTRSLSLLDWNGDGIVWSRQTYFAARVPAQGIVLRPDTQIAPMMVNSNRELPESQQWDLDGAQQYRGLLPPRIQSQFSVAHPLRKLKPFRNVPNVSTPFPDIVNESSVSWSTAVFFDSNETAYLASDVLHGQTAKFQQVSKDEALAAMRQAYQSRPLQAPDDAPSADQISLNQFFGDIFSFNRSRNNSMGLIMEESFWMSHIGFPLSTLQSFNSNMGTSMAAVFAPPSSFANTYVLFSDEAPYLERCLPNLRDDSSLHTIIGRWQFE